MTCLVKLEPGTFPPMHVHAELEGAYLLGGSFTDHDGTTDAGDYVRRKAGSVRETGGGTGAVVFAVYRTPNIFQHSTGLTAATAKQS